MPPPMDEVYPQKVMVESHRGRLVEETHLTARTFFSVHARPIALFIVLVLFGSRRADAHDVKTLFFFFFFFNVLSQKTSPSACNVIDR